MGKLKENIKVLKRFLMPKFWNALGIILCCSFILSFFIPLTTTKALSFKNGVRLVDPDTTDDYISRMINSTNGSRFAGRIWSDKSVFRNDIVLDYETDGYEGTITNNSDFLHVFSALGSSQAWIGLPPSRTVIVIDNSSSMYSNNTEWTKTRVANTIEATNKAIDSLMRTSQYNEIAVVLFGDGSGSYFNDTQNDNTSANTAKVIVPMGHYPVSENQAIPYKYLDAGWDTTSNGSSSSGNFPSTPVKDNKTGTKNSSGFVYVDKQYVNDKFEVDSTLENKKGTERYNVYKNGTTNIQAGFHVAYQELLKGKKEVTVGGYKFGYLPNIIMLTDGAATDMLQGTYSNPDLKDRGFTNDRGTKLASYIEVFRDSNGKNTADWNMYVEIIDKNGEKTFEQLGYGNGTLREGLIVGENQGNNKDNSVNPDEKGLEGMKKFAEDVRSTQGTMLLSTLMMVAYEKAVIAKEYGNECDIYTISVDVGNPEDIDLNPNDEFDNDLKNFSSSAATMNPNKYFNLKWLQEKGFIKSTADLNNLKEEDLAFKPYTVGSELIMSLDAAINAWNEFKSGSDSTEARDKLKTYLVYQEHKGLYNDMKDKKVKYNGKDYEATDPIGPSHNNAYLIEHRYSNITYNHLQKDDKDNNPYGISDEDLDINYVKKAFYPKTNNETKDSITSAFDEITKSIKRPAFVPTHDSFSNADNLIYSDPIGKYMEVKDVKNLLLFGELYEISKTDFKYVTKIGESETESSTKTGNYARQYYKVVNNGQNELINDCYKIVDESDELDSEVTFNLNDIKIYVETNLNAGPLENEQTLYVEIPSTALPLQVVTIKLNEEGDSTYYHTNIDDKKNSTPLRIFYEVGIDDNVLINNKKDIDLSKISDEYKAKYSKNNELYLYSNYYSNSVYDGYIADTQDAARTRGDAVTIFSPSEANRYYVFQKNLPLYSKAYIVQADGSLKEITDDEAKTFTGANYYGEIKDEEGTRPSVQELLNQGNVKAGDVVTYSSDKVPYTSNPSSDAYYFVAIDYYVPNGEDKGKKVQTIVSRLGSEFGSGILGDQVAEGEYLCWYDENGKSSKTYNYNEEISSDEINNGSHWILGTKIGGLRIGDLHQGILLKSNNVTGTSKSYYLPIIADDLSTAGYDAILNGYLGNNGVIKYGLSGTPAGDEDNEIEIPNTADNDFIVYMIMVSLSSLIALNAYKRQFLKGQRYKIPN